MKKDSLLLYFLIIAIVVFGCFMVYSASWYYSETMLHNKFFYLKKQVIGAFVGLVLMTFFCFFNVERIKKFLVTIVVVTIVLLLLVFVKGIGVENYGAKRWINLGFTTIQPSEIAKFTLIFFASVSAGKMQENNIGIKNKLPILLVGGVFCVLILLEPNLSITVCMAMLTAMIVIFLGLSKKWIVGFCVMGLIGLVVLIAIEPYRLLRLQAFINPWLKPKDEGYQLIQSLYAIGNGGLFGVGFLNSRQARQFLSFSESDFIFSIIAEEFGLFGVTILMLSYFMMFYLLVKMVYSSKNAFASTFIFGVATIITVQVLINIAVVTGSIPPTGLPLPFISSGNTQIIMFMTEIGMAIGVHSHQQAPNKSLFHKM